MRATILLSALLFPLVLVACSGGGGAGGGDQTLAVAASNAPAAPDPNNPGVVTGPITPGPGGLDGETSFEQTVYPIVSTYCSQCHAGAGPGFPFMDSSC